MLLTIPARARPPIYLSTYFTWFSNKINRVNNIKWTGVFTAQTLAINRGFFDYRLCTHPNSEKKIIINEMLEAAEHLRIGMHEGAWRYSPFLLLYSKSWAVVVRFSQLSDITAYTSTLHIYTTNLAALLIFSWFCSKVSLFHLKIFKQGFRSNILLVDMYILFDQYDLWTLIALVIWSKVTFLQQNSLVVKWTARNCFSDRILLKSSAILCMCHLVV